MNSFKKIFLKILLHPETIDENYLTKQKFSLSFCCEFPNYCDYYYRDNSKDNNYYYGNYSAKHKFIS